eukprot:TRINITY_DN4926_c0_g1_i1.p1 TRINITY_DN4926_c0_g1~~TRINITY_DN4926_c0_g1_i1.p1  ORF type:complete len:122 (-),score=8.70 TRINITY_DN4926_c0_g1_i1:175-540(-)
MQRSNAILVIFPLLLALLAQSDASIYTKEIMKICEHKCLFNCKLYKIPLQHCFSPQQLFPGDTTWGTNDVFDRANSSYLVRSFYESSNGSCTTVSDSFEIPLNTCVGPFGPPRPWGIFIVE